MPLPDNKELMMHKAEKKYEVGKLVDEEEAKQRQLRAILNKLTPTKFEKLFEQVKAVNIDNVATLTGVVSQIVDRASMEPIYCEMYVNFCCHLAGELPDFNEDNEKITFKRVLLNKCQWEFERGEREREQEEEANKADEEGEIHQSAEEREEKRVKARRRMLGNIRLTGELYKKKMLTERVMHACIQKLLGQFQDPDEEDLEALCKLMGTIGEMIDHEKAKEHMDRYFERMKTLSNNMNLSSRVRFMLKDGIDLRKNKWQQRRKVEGPKKIEEVHRDTAKERHVQFSSLGRGSSKNQSARRAPMDFGPRGSMKLSSPNAQMGDYRGVPPTQDIRSEQRLSGNQELMIKDLTLTNQLLLRKLERWQWWFFVALNIFFLAVGQSTVVLNGRFYHDQGGNGKWMATLVQTAAFPILFIPLFLIPSSQQPSTSLAPPSIKILALIYFSLGVLISGDNMMYSVGLLYLPASTYSLICVSQLAFNVVFSYFINSQRFTASVVNSVVVLSLSAALIAVNDDSEGPSGISRWKYIIGLLCTLGGSALYSLLHSLMQLSFQKILKRETFSVVLEMQIYTSLVATCVSIVGLFASGEWKSLHGEMESFGAGRVPYVMTLVSTAVAWQIYSVGVVGLIFVASSLFSNVISTVSFAVTPIAFVIVFHDKMNSIKVIAMLLALWSSVSYIYQNYPDDSKTSRTLNDVIESHNDYHKARRTQNDVSATNIQHKGSIPSPQTPLLMMHKAKKKYEVGKVVDEEEAKQRQLRAILNKLTPTKFEKLFEQVKAVNIDNVATLAGVVSQIFDRGLMEPMYCEMYVNFFCRLAGELPDFNEDNEKITFKRVLLNKCQEEFERGEREQEEANKVDEEGEIKQSAEEREEKRVKARRRMLGNIRLIGELYKKKMLTERIMHACIQKLLGQFQDPDEEDLEALCKLMSTIGEMIDHQKAKEHMDAYFDRMKTLSNNMNLSSRVRFMLKDAIDLRKNKWQQRRTVEGPKKIEDVHKDAAQERQAKKLAGDYREILPTPDVWSEESERQSYEVGTLSIPLLQRPIGDDSTSLGPQVG
ncbi:uncharacterized protein LOC132185427 isoform X2 [Corylus avellana]|uniref:uncharacterized protein LOC132185427 isoform X2 n=1 Tax=Corylus avellana TaxID=13451 RepID=UPI002869BF1B|nr:uncharacterized protein LOC132185427 isoform X2 [Corylus avellana]